MNGQIRMQRGGFIENNGCSEKGGNQGPDRKPKTKTSIPRKNQNPRWGLKLPPRAMHTLARISRKKPNNCKSPKNRRRWFFGYQCPIFTVVTPPRGLVVRRGGSNPRKHKKGRLRTASDQSKTLAKKHRRVGRKEGRSTSGPPTGIKKNTPKKQSPKNTRVC